MAQTDKRDRDGRIERSHDCETRLADVPFRPYRSKECAVLDHSKRLQLAMPFLALIEGDLPQHKAEDILLQTLETLRA